MSLLSRLDSKFGRFAVPNLTIVLIFGQVLMYFANQLQVGAGADNVLEKIRLYPDEVLSGEVWRLVTFLFDPPITNLIFAAFFWYLFYIMGTALEGVWGTFRYNIFLLVGYLASVAMAFAAALVGNPEAAASNAFLYGTVFLAFARFYPDFVMYLFFILPVKIKWLALLQWIGYGVAFVTGPWMVRAMVAASVANYFLFFGRDLWRDMKQGHRRMQHQVHARKAPTRIIHKCVVCGLSSDESPRTQFRYCSKCENGACYCPEHLATHEHVTASTTGDAEKTAS